MKRCLNVWDGSNSTGGVGRGRGNESDHQSTRQQLREGGTFAWHRSKDLQGVFADGRLQPVLRSIAKNLPAVVVPEQVREPAQQDPVGWAAASAPSRSPAGTNCLAAAASHCVEGHPYEVDGLACLLRSAETDLRFTPPAPTRGPFRGIPARTRLPVAVSGVVHRSSMRSSCAAVRSDRRSAGSTPARGAGR